MTTSAPLHLTTEELDAFLLGTPSLRAVSHCATCPACDRLVQQDALVVRALGALPSFDPGPGFVERVMADVHLARPLAVPAPAPIPARSARAQSARRHLVAAGVLLGTATTAGFAWAAANPADALGFATPALREVGSALWLSLQAIAANTAEQPWFGALRDTLAVPARAVPLVVGAAALYAAALTGFKRLLTGPAIDAGR